MKARQKYWYRTIKKLLGFTKDDYWDDNPFVLL
jgi:hypothetical protein